jgi:hypothetical protein
MCGNKTFITANFVPSPVKYLKTSFQVYGSSNGEPFVVTLSKNGNAVFTTNVDTTVLSAGQIASFNYDTDVLVESNAYVSIDYAGGGGMGVGGTISLVEII